MTRRTISSPLTLVSKIIFPLAVLAAFGHSLFLLFPAARPRDFVYSAVWLAALVFVYFTCGQLKYVAIDRTSVYISNFMREIRVPLSNVAEITQNRLLNINRVRITFDGETAFGKKIVFMPEPRLSNIWSRHPIAAEFEGLMANTRQAKNHGTNTEEPEHRASPDQLR